MINNIKIEICIGNAPDAIKASKYPIDRIELNSAIELGGLTSTANTVKYLKQNIPQQIACMVRTRTGDFVYTDIEYELMLNEAKQLLDAGADAIVFGYLNKDNTVNINETKRMIELIHSYKKEAVFHKASDCFANIDEGFKILYDLGIDRVLTGGGYSTDKILDGAKVINDLRIKYGDKIQFLPGGGVRINNVQDILKISGCNQIHMTSKKQNEGGYLEFDEEQFIQIMHKIEEM